MSDSKELILFSEILSATTEAEMAAKMAIMAPRLGCEQILFGIELRRPLMPVVQHITSCYPEDYQRLYHLKGFIARDPSVSHCQNKTEPIVWTTEMYDRTSYELMEESRKFGLGHGFSVPVRESDSVVSMISLGRDQRFTESELGHVMPSAKVLAGCLHVAAQKLIVPDVLEARRPKLSARELECLKWIAQGKSNTMIADILLISDATVAFHVNSALKKLGVATRIQAVGVCISLGMIA